MDDKLFFLSTFPTRYLLSLFKKVRYDNIQSRYYDDVESFVDVSFYKKGGINVNLKLSYDDLKNELNKRENVSTNKVYNKKVRQLLACENRKNKLNNMTIKRKYVK